MESLIMLAKNYEYRFINYGANELLKSEDYGGYLESIVWWW
jgi:hypothetical protein